LSATAVQLINSNQNLKFGTNNYGDEGVHTITVSSNVPVNSQKSSVYASNPITFTYTVSLCVPSYTVSTMIEDFTYTIYASAVTQTTNNQITIADANSCGFESLLSLTITAAPTWK
jgi:hypothetical protein